MKRIGIILVFCTLWTTNGMAVSRVSSASTSSVRNGNTTQRVRTQPVQKTKTTRVATPQKTTVSRTATNTTSRTITKRGTSRAAVVERAETRTGAEYEQCKNAYFTCMDQFCQLKNDEYRRCSCSDRITSLQSARDNLQQAAEQLTAFNENLDIVGKTAAQAAAMNTASDGELAMGKDNSASKALLTAIMNTIRGTSANVENSQLSSLNSIDLSFDTANSFGTRDVGQTIASYNGTALYSAVYPQCRDAVKSNCNDASLQRAVNAYLMAIEQDCNTVQTAITTKQKQTHAAIRESSSMLDMARAENHRAHNADDIATCLANVESAILSEEVCGSNYHKCLDNGEYIDVSTGAPISGVVDFYKLGTMLTFNSGRNNADQKLAQNPNNRTFVTNFEKRVKQFAEPALNKCYDDADTVWADYLNKAMLDIYYAQQSKVEEIKQGCFDFVSACYMNGSTAMTNAMQGLVAAQTTTLNPNVLKLNSSLCADYIASCNNMFDGEIVNQYIENRHDTDSLSACRAVAKQCFDNYGGQNYENFYKPSSGLFSKGHAPDWFALYECKSYNASGTCTSYACNNTNTTSGTVSDCDTKGGIKYISECAKQLAEIDACAPMVEQAFGGFNYYSGSNATVYNRYGYNGKNRELRSSGIATEVYNQIIDTLQIGCSNLDGKFMNVQNLALYAYNYNQNAFCEATFGNATSRYYNLHTLYSIGKSYSQKEIVSVFKDFSAPRSALSTTHKQMLRGRVGAGSGLPPDPGISINPDTPGQQPLVNKEIFYTQINHIQIKENMCPLDYGSDIDVQSWGACLCWENGGRRSNNGTSIRCTPSFPVHPLTSYTVTETVIGTVSEEQNIDNLDDIQTEYSAKQTITNGTGTNCINTSGWTITLNPNKSSNQTVKTFTKWPYDIGESKTDLPTKQDWCTAEVNKNNQVCPFGVALDSQGNCMACPVDYTNVDTNKCCPSDYPNATTNSGIVYCCPTGYEYITSSKKCENSSDSSDKQDYKTGTLISSEIMGENFPEG